MLARALRKPAAELAAEMTADDALSFACSEAFFLPSLARGYTATWTTLGTTGADFIKLFNTHPMVTMPEDTIPTRMVTLLMDLIRAPPQSVPELALNGAWNGIGCCSSLGRLAVAKHALESGIMDLCASCINQLGSAS